MGLDLVERPARHAETLGPCPVIRTARLTLRPHRMEDARAIALSLADHAVSRMLLRVPQPYHLADARDWLEDRRQADANADSRDWHLAITREGNQHIGMVGIDRRGAAWHLGYWLNRSAWGHGLMREAVRATLEAVFERLPSAVVESGVFADNPASLRIQERTGFAVTGVADVFVPARSRTVNLIRTRLTREAFRAAG